MSPPLTSSLFNSQQVPGSFTHRVSPKFEEVPLRYHVLLQEFEIDVLLLNLPNNFVSSESVVPLMSFLVTSHMKSYRSSHLKITIVGFLYYL